MACGKVPTEKSFAFDEEDDFGDFEQAFDPRASLQSVQSETSLSSSRDFSAPLPLSLFGDDDFEDPVIQLQPPPQLPSHSSTSEIDSQFSANQLEAKGNFSNSEPDLSDDTHTEGENQFAIGQHSISPQAVATVGIVNMAEFPTADEPSTATTDSVVPEILNATSDLTLELETVSTATDEIEDDWGDFADASEPTDPPLHFQAPQSQPVLLASQNASLFQGESSSPVVFEPFKLDLTDSQANSAWVEIETTADHFPSGDLSHPTIEEASEKRETVSAEFKLGKPFSSYGLPAAENNAESNQNSVPNDPSDPKLSSIYDEVQPAVSEQRMENPEPFDEFGDFEAAFSSTPSQAHSMTVARVPLSGSPLSRDTELFSTPPDAQWHPVIEQNTEAEQPESQFRGSSSNEYKFGEFSSPLGDSDGLTSTQNKPELSQVPDQVPGPESPFSGASNTANTNPKQGPIPLSLFGELEPSAGLDNDVATSHWLGDKLGKSPQPAKSPEPSANLLDFISSLYGGSTPVKQEEGLLQQAMAKEELSPQEAGLAESDWMDVELGNGRVSTRLQRVATSALTVPDLDAILAGQMFAQTCKAEGEETETEQGKLPGALEGLPEALLKEGRVWEAYMCSAHLAASHSLAGLKAAYVAALEEASIETAGAIRLEIQRAEAALSPESRRNSWSAPRVPPEPSRSEIPSPLDPSVLCLTLQDMALRLGGAQGDPRAQAFTSAFLQDQKVPSKAELAAALQAHFQAVLSYCQLACTSAQNQARFVRSWSLLAEQCKALLQEARKLLGSIPASTRSRIFSPDSATETGPPQAYIRALSRTFLVLSMLSASCQLYAPWLRVPEFPGGSPVGTSVWTALLSAFEDYAAVQALLAGDADQPETTGKFPSWGEGEGVFEAAECAARVSFEGFLEGRSPGLLCELTLLPVVVFEDVPVVEWSGRHYLVPVANLWANRVSPQPPELPKL